MAETISTDYLVKGAGAVGMAFADAVLTENASATIVLADRRDRPGGHWNDAYPFVRLHQPAGFYGVNSMPLGDGTKDSSGLNSGFYDLASGQEVLSHYDQVLRQRFLDSGRVRWFPMSEVGDDNVVTSLLSGEQVSVDAGRLVDATYSQMRVPSVNGPSYEVDPAVAFVAPNALPRMAAAFDDYVVIGAGKTGMDACIWLLANGADPDAIRWIMPRDSWVLNRRNFQPGEEFFADFCRSLADQVEAAALAESEEDLFARLEAYDELWRIDPTVTPEAYHCAILSAGELAELRRIGQIVRLGHVQSIGPSEITMDDGVLPTGSRTLHIDCSAAGIPSCPSTRIFDGDRITLQWVRTCQPAFSAAFIGFVESAFTEEDEKNRLCEPIVPPSKPRDWLRMLRQQLDVRALWATYPAVEDWLVASRLDAFAVNLRSRLGVDVEATEEIGRYLGHIGPAMAKLDEFLGLEPTVRITP